MHIYEKEKVGRGKNAKKKRNNDVIVYYDGND